MIPGQSFTQFPTRRYDRCNEEGSSRSGLHLLSNWFIWCLLSFCCNQQSTSSNQKWRLSYLALRPRHWAVIGQFLNSQEWMWTLETVASLIFELKSETKELTSSIEGLRKVNPKLSYRFWYQSQLRLDKMPLNLNWTRSRFCQQQAINKSYIM